jgi:hypothetical protein
MPSMEFANIELFALLLPFDSADIVTSIGTPKRYALWLTGKQLYVFVCTQNNQQSMELFCGVTKERTFVSRSFIKHLAIPNEL